MATTLRRRPTIAPAAKKSSSGKAGGILVGNKHTRGGIKVINKSDPDKPIEVEGGEVVITAPAVADEKTLHEFDGKKMTKREILSEINVQGGGVAFADGGRVPKKIRCTGRQYRYGGKLMADHEIVKSCGCKHSKMESGGEIPKDFPAELKELIEEEGAEIIEVEKLENGWYVKEQKKKWTVRQDYDENHGDPISKEEFDTEQEAIDALDELEEPDEWNTRSTEHYAVVTEDIWQRETIYKYDEDLEEWEDDGETWPKYPDESERTEFYKSFGTREGDARDLESHAYWHLRDDVSGEYDTQGYKIHIRSGGKGKYGTLWIEDDQRNDIGNIELRISDHSYNPANNYGKSFDAFISVVIANEDETADRFSNFYSLYFNGDNEYEEIVSEVKDKIQEILDNLDLKERIESENNKMAKGGPFKKALSVSAIAKLHKVPVKYIQQQLKSGIKVESEHSKDPKVQSMIARQHLKEDADCCGGLAIVEKKEHGGMINEALDKAIELLKKNKSLADTWKMMLQHNAPELIKFIADQAQNITAQGIKNTADPGAARLETEQIFGKKVVDLAIAAFPAKMKTGGILTVPIGHGDIKRELADFYTLSGRSRDYRLLNEITDFVLPGSFTNGGTIFKKGGEINITGKQYANAFELNKAIEKLLDSKTDNNDFSTEEKTFLKYYSGYGGLEKYGAEGKGLLYEYFTPSLIAEKMWGLAYKYGFNGGEVLEPAAGIGEFVKYAPTESQVTAYEINPYSARILKILYPKAKVFQKYFEELFIVNRDTIKGKTAGLKKYDLVIGNPPYGEFIYKFAGMGEKQYTRAHNYIDYFIFRGLDLLKVNGLLVFIVGAEVASGGKPFLQQQTNACKREIMEKSDLIDAYRLPNGVFERTDVLTDIIVLRKK